MDDPHNQGTDCEPLIARATERAELLEHVAGQTFCRLTALAGMLARLKELARSRDPEAAEAMPPDPATIGRDAEILLRYFDSRPWDSVGVATNGARREQTRASLHAGKAAVG
jgi:hypothetical protein